MRKISQLQQEAAIELLGDIIEPTATILADKDIGQVIRNGGAPITAVKIACKRYAAELIDILAAVEGVPRSEYKCNILTLPIAAMDLINDEELQDFFISQAGVDLTAAISKSPAEVTTDTEA